ncbi:MAG: hypothetical protein KC431_21525 [Myxococcales bacterium]|nr:hypothetical protein [Myxococcales bacterium]
MSVDLERARSLAAEVVGDRPTVGYDALTRTRAYLEQLPGGLEGFPKCQAKAVIHRHVQGSSKVAIEGLPPDIQRYLDTPSKDTWIPQAHSLALILALIEGQGLGAGSEAEDLWIRRAARALFASPMHAMLMRAVSPRLMVKGANLRWSAFFRGSTLHSEVRSDEAEVLLEAPVGLYDRNMAEVFTSVLRGAVAFADSQDEPMSVELVGVAPGRALYYCSW